MGYNTIYEGELKFTKELTATQLAKVKAFFGEDRRDHPEWNAPDDFYYMDLVLLDDFSGLKWDDETEKTYGMPEIINTITQNMRTSFPEFGLVGEMICQGEDADDRWKLLIDEDGKAYRKDYPHHGDKVTCPHCEGTFHI